MRTSLLRMWIMHRRIAWTIKNGRRDWWWDQRSRRGGVSELIDNWQVGQSGVCAVGHDLCRLSHRSLLGNNRLWVLCRSRGWPGRRPDSRRGSSALARVYVAWSLGAFWPLGGPLASFCRHSASVVSPWAECIVPKSFRTIQVAWLSSKPWRIKS